MTTILSFGGDVRVVACSMGAFVVFIVVDDALSEYVFVFAGIILDDVSGNCVVIVETAYN